MKQTIRLTESELQYMIEQSINEALIEEGLWGGIGALGQKATNKMKQVGQNLKTNVQNTYDKAKEGITTAYNNAKTTYQVGSINQEAQKAINTAEQALKDLIDIDKKLEQYGGSAIGDNVQRQAIKDCLNALKGGGNASISSRFQARRDARTQPGAKF